MAKQTQQEHGLSPRVQRTISFMSTVTVYVLAVAAAFLSFNGLRQLGIDAGFDPHFAWLLPIIVDGMVLTGSLGVIVAGLVGIPTWYPWAITAIGVALSIWGNITAAPDDMVARIVHAVPPLTFALSIEGMLRIYRASAVANANREAAELAREDRRLDREAKNAERMARLGGIVGATGSAQAVQEEPAAALPARERVAQYLAEHPQASGGEIARALDIDPSYTRKLLRSLRGGADNATEDSREEGQDGQTVHVTMHEFARFPETELIDELEPATAN